MITSRDGTSVATFCPYYYYGAGIRCFMIDKTNNTYTTFSQNSSGAGCMTIPYGDSGWSFAMGQNMYSSNYTGSFVHSKWSKTAAGGFSQESSNQYWPYFTGPNTTNYPGFTQVTDYVLLQDNASGPK